ncbi:DUF1156 domain-containing protein [Haliangium sp.]|uniref:DUF1156 domain-containing protein n=1 Tax=Haliangium sp. TaxID=2663208 RepID=UPI003D10997E
MLATRAPTLASTTGHPRLIEDGLDQAASAVGRAERYRRGETAHTIHVWWARRPHAAMRGLVFASLSRDRGSDARALLTRLGRATTLSEAELRLGRAHVAEQYPAPPVVLDMFGGGGTVALEGLRLGADVHLVESNELAAFLATCNLVYGHGLDVPDPGAFLAALGDRVLARLAAITAPAFPLRQRPGGAVAATYFWTYRRPCPGCGYGVLLSRRRWLSRRHRVALRVRTGASGDYCELVSEPGRDRASGCPRCGHDQPRPHVGQGEDALLALAYVDPARPRAGKRYQLAPADALPPAALLADLEAQLLAELGAELPSSRLPRWSGIINPALHGIERHSDIFNSRQRVVLLALIAALRAEHRLLRREVGEATARWATATISALIDQCVDWNSRLSMWIPQNEQVGRAFCGPGVAMVWDYAETDPVGPGPSNLHRKLARVVAGVGWIGALPRPARVHLSSAQALPLPDASVDAVIADPPYYDNVYYSTLADFFYPWKRMALHDLAPALFGPSVTSSEHELVASAQREGDPARAHARYVHGLAAALTEAARVMKPDAVTTMIYAHRALDGWAALIEAWARAPLTIVAVHPLDLERRQRPRAMTVRAQHLSLLLVGRHRGRVTSDAGPSSDTALCTLVNEMCRGGPARELLEAGWTEAAVGLTLFGRGAALAAHPILASDRRALRATLRAIADTVTVHLPGFRLTARRSQ